MIIGDINSEGLPVVRKTRSDGESAWKLYPDGTFAVCLDHKGPWVGCSAEDVPDDVLVRLAALESEI